MIFSKNKNKKTEAVQRPAKKSHWRRYFFLALLVLVMITAAGVYDFAQKPAAGVIKPPKQEDPLQKIAQEVPGSFTGTYVTFMYPNGYALKSHDVSKDGNAVILEQAYLSETSATSKKIALTVRNLPNHNPEDDPDYKMREIDTKKYKKGNFSEGNIKGITFVPTNDSQFEKTIFLLHGEYLAIISMTAPAAQDEKLEKEADSIIKSISWLK